MQHAQEHRPYVVLGECSRILGLYDAAQRNLTLAAQLAAPEQGEFVAGLLYTLRREKDMFDHGNLNRQGFAGFRTAYDNTQPSAAAGG